MQMGLHTIKAGKGARKRRKRLGAGNASGHGTYSGRGVKGQKARTGGRRRPGFEGGQTPMVQKMPKLRGFKNPNRIPYQAVNLGALNVFDDGANVDLAALYEKNLISKKTAPVKLLGDGTLKKKLVIKVDAASKNAAEKVKEAGGTLTVTEKNDAPGGRPNL